MSIFYHRLLMGRGGGGISWLLRDDFTDTLTAGNVNGTAATPGPGTRAVVDTNSIMSISGGYFVINGTPVLNDVLNYGTFTHQNGLIGIIQITERTTFTSGRARFGFDDELGASLNIGVDSAAADEFRIKNGVGVADTLIGLLNPGTWTLYMVLGDGNDYLFLKQGAGDTTLIWVYTSSGSNDYLKAVHTNAESVYKIGMMGIPDELWLPTPLAYDTFTAANGTSLDAHTSNTTGPDGQAVTGRAWVEKSGDWDIQTNRANPDGAAIATVDIGEADIVADCTVNGGTAGQPAILLRYADASNYWYLQADRANNQFELHEVNATVDTVRANAGVTINNSTDYKLRAIAYGTTIDGFINGANKISYASASLNQTETEHGLIADHTECQFDNFTIFSRDGAYSDLDKYIA